MHAGPFPGTALAARWPVAVSAAVVLAWLAVFVGSAAFFVMRRDCGVRRFGHSRFGYSRIGHTGAEDRPVLALPQVRGAGVPGGACRSAVMHRLLRRVALVLSVVVLAAAAYQSAGLRADATTYTRYLFLLAIVFAALRCLLWPETRAAWRQMLAGPASALVSMSFVALIVAAAAVGVVDLLLHTDGRWNLHYQLTRVGFVVNAALLASLYGAALALTRRFWTAIWVGTAAYLALGFANWGKMHYMHAAVQPLDVLYLREFMPQLNATFGGAATVALIGLAALFVHGLVRTWRHPVAVLGARHRIAVGCAALAILAAASTSQKLEPARRAWEAVGLEIRVWESVPSARQNGLLFEFLSYVPNLWVSAPADYSADRVAALAARYAHRSAYAPQSRRVSIVVYMIESLMDPRDLGLRFSADPIPTIRRLAARHSSGRAIVPARFGESASSEFEVLTGMSMAFLPERSVVYKQHVRRRLPSLPCLLRRKGYGTAAVLADPIEYYNRPEVYPYLCFDRVDWLHEDVSVPRAVNGRAPADDAVVDAVIAEVESAHPAFVFAFPNSTHHPYELDHYADAELDLAEPAASAARDELKYYINTLRVADAAVGRLIEHFAAGDRDVIVAVVGDHLPPLSVEALEQFYDRLGRDAPEIDRLLAERSVPLVVWSSFEQPREDLRLSLNLLGPYLLARAGVEPSGFLAFVDRLRRDLPVLSHGLLAVEGEYLRLDAAPARHLRSIRDYRLLQHDFLFGEAYFEAAIAAAEDGVVLR